jgi:hypothetical protein
MCGCLIERDILYLITQVITMEFAGQSKEHHVDLSNKITVHSMFFGPLFGFNLSHLNTLSFTQNMQHRMVARR